MIEHAQAWDNFLEWVRLIQTPWASDSDEYRKSRAVSWFNCARRCSRDLYTLKPTMLTWVPHIASYIVPRQIVLMGNPSSRSADSCESFGAVVKKVIKHLTCRRHVRPKGSITHHRGPKAWGQSFTRGYVEQCFRRTAVRSSLLHGEDNVPYLERQHYRLKSHGRFTNSKPPVATCEVSVTHLVRCLAAAEFAAS